MDLNSDKDLSTSDPKDPESENDQTSLDSSIQEDKFGTEDGKTSITDEAKNQDLTGSEIFENEHEDNDKEFESNIDSDATAKEFLSKDTNDISESEEVSSEHSLTDLASEPFPDEENLHTNPAKSRVFSSETSNLDSENLEEKDPSIPPLSTKFSNDNNPFSKSISYNQNNNFRTTSSGGNKIHLLILTIIGISVILGTIYLLKGGSINLSSSSTSTPSPQNSSPSPTPSPTPAIILDRSKLKVRVLNGTTKTGLASSVSDKLKQLGYQTDKIGNATNSAFQRTVVRVKDSTTSASLTDQLIKDLSPDFDATPSSPLSSGDSADSEIILGLK